MGVPLGDGGQKKFNWGSELSIARRAIESRVEKVESRISGFGLPLSPPLLGLFTTYYSLLPDVALAFSFEKLVVYRTSVDFADAICQAHRAVFARRPHFSLL